MIKHGIVYLEKGRFGGWPANHGMWVWDNEILVAFKNCRFKLDPFGSHAIDRGDYQYTVQARSLDGGESWRCENPCLKPIPPASQGVPSSDDLLPCPGGINFLGSDFCMMFNMSGVGPDQFSWWYCSENRGRTWQGPYQICINEVKSIQTRTDYHVLSSSEALLFMTCGKSSGAEGRVFTASLKNGGKDFNFISFINPDPDGWEIMPASAKRTNNEMVCLVRCRIASQNNRNCIVQYESTDNCNSWKLTGTIEDDANSNPPALLIARNGVWVLVYGKRTSPYGLIARFSDDEGRTWSKRKYLREDGGCFDLGYPRLVENGKGQYVTTYYYTTDPNTERFIGYTIFDKML